MEAGDDDNTHENGGSPGPQLGWCIPAATKVRHFSSIGGLTSSQSEDGDVKRASSSSLTSSPPHQPSTTEPGYRHPRSQHPRHANTSLHYPDRHCKGCHVPAGTPAPLLCCPKHRQHPRQDQGHTQGGHRPPQRSCQRCYVTCGSLIYPSHWCAPCHAAPYPSALSCPRPLTAGPLASTAIAKSPVPTTPSLSRPHENARYVNWRALGDREISSGECEPQGLCPTSLV